MALPCLESLIMMVILREVKQTTDGKWRNWLAEATDCITQEKNVVRSSETGL